METHNIATANAVWLGGRGRLATDCVLLLSAVRNRYAPLGAPASAVARSVGLGPGGGRVPVREKRLGRKRHQN
jgi:hypothetical protein